MKDDDVAAAAERARQTVDRATWVAIGLGLAFTAVNVQLFAAAGAPVGSPGWVVAWALDPMVSVLLLAVVRAEQVTARWQIAMPWQVTATKWSAFAATYLMNTWSAWRNGVPSAVVLHSVPPVFVLLAAEVAPALRDRLSEAVRIAASTHLASSPIAPGEQTPEQAGQVPEVARSAFGGTPLASDVAADEVSRVEELDRAAGAPEQADPVDPRVREVAYLLSAGCEVTGAQTAALHGVSDRTGRRLLADARTHLEQHPSRPDLHLVEARTAGGTA